MSKFIDISMKCAQSINPAFNWHLSAMRISKEMIQALEKDFSFRRDEFTNNTYCETTVYHGTFKGHEENMTRKTWNEIVYLLASDQTFEGDLEEEIILPQHVSLFSSSGDDANPASQIEKRIIKPCPAGVYKECDIHLKITWDKTQESVKNTLNALGMISFDRPTENGKFNRIYTLTFQSLKDGLAHFEHMRARLNEVRGIEARLKLEIATCFYRQPEQAIVLPIVLH